MAGHMFDGAPTWSPGDENAPGLLVRSPGDARPMRLSREWACSPQGQIDLRECLAAGCSCGHDVATLTKRVNKGGARYVALQCENCGTNLAFQMRRADHPHWDGYPLWDEDKNPRYWRLWRAQSEARRERWIMDKRTENEAFYQSEEWRALREAVFQRANYTCEKCRRWPAQTAHHTTYALGMLAPIGTLVAVCDPCHKRLHTRGDPWHDPSLPAHYGNSGDWWNE